MHEPRCVPYQFPSLLLFRFLVPFLVDVSLEPFDEGPWVVLRVEQLEEVIDVGSGQPQGLDLGELRVAGDVGDAVPEVGEGVVDRLGASPLLLVGPGDHNEAAGPGSRGRRGRRR